MRIVNRPCRARAVHNSLDGLLHASARAAPARACVDIFARVEDDAVGVVVLTHVAITEQPSVCAELGHRQRHHAADRVGVVLLAVVPRAHPRTAARALPYEQLERVSIVEAARHGVRTAAQSPTIAYPRLQPSRSFGRVPESHGGSRAFRSRIAHKVRAMNGRLRIAPRRPFMSGEARASQARRAGARGGRVSRRASRRPVRADRARDRIGRRAIHPASRTPRSRTPRSFSEREQCCGGAPMRGTLSIDPLYSKVSYASRPPLGLLHLRRRRRMW
jgi:hypothetical protein